MNMLELIGFDKNDQNLKSYIINLNEDLSQEADDVKVYAYEARKLSNKINYILLQNNLNSLKPISYIIDNSNEEIIEDILDEIKYSLWINSFVPILYIINKFNIDIFFTNQKPSKNEFKFISDIIDFTDKKKKEENEIKLKKYSIYRLIDGTFWEDKSNEDKIIKKSYAHKILIDKIEDADKAIISKFKNKKHKHNVARRLLIITLLIKYLEDRKVLKESFFHKIHKDYYSYIDILKNKNVEALKNLLHILEYKFNGDIFVLENVDELDENIIAKLYEVIEPKKYKNQWYLWELYNFSHIPIEVLSSIYQYFANDKLGAVFTPIHLVNVILDEVMPLNKIIGNETVFDPTCGSGIFLVSALKRLILKNIIKKNISSPNDNYMLSPEELKNILNNSIFGIEIQDEAAHLTCFSLALGICDALTPNVIWEYLKFDKLINKNIFIKDFFEVSIDLKDKFKQGFDIIIGNPPFETDDRKKLKNKNNIKKGEIAFDIQLECLEKYLSDDGKLFIIQPNGILYKKKLEHRKKELFNNFYVHKIYDFTSIRYLFDKGNAKCVALLITKNYGTNKNHEIVHIVFRNSFISNNKIFFELNYYDFNKVYNDDIINYRFTCLSNLFGGGRILYLMKKLNDMTTIESFLKSKNLKIYEGYKVGKSSSLKKEALWLSNMNNITLEQLSKVNFSIDNIINTLQKVKEKEFNRAREPYKYKAPLFIIYKNIELDCAISKKYDIAYSDRMIGIPANNNENILMDFAKEFYKNKKMISNMIKILSTYSISQRETITKDDIASIPFDINFDINIESKLLQWEKDIINDMDYIIDYIKKGHKSKIMISTINKDRLKEYNDTFIRLMKTSFINFDYLKYFENNGLIISIYSFNKNTNFNIKNTEEVWTNNLIKEIRYKYGNSLYINRIIRIISKDILIIIKPNKLRYWIKSVAIRDVDDVINDIITKG